MIKIYILLLNLLPICCFIRNNKNYNPFVKKYYKEKPFFEKEFANLNSKNITIQNNAILGIYYNKKEIDGDIELQEENDADSSYRDFQSPELTYKNYGDNLRKSIFEEDDNTGKKRYIEREDTKSKNFEVIYKNSVKFNYIGGYKNVKEELLQCVDILKNYHKYLKYNVRIPKGLILEGPPGTGKTLFAKALAGEANCGFIAVSGSDFQEKYVGVGSSKVKELMELAKKHVPCIVFIDEIDAIGRKRSTDGESSSHERDSTLNSLLVELDGFKNNTGIFLLAATNRIDLLDSALIRAGRIDKKIYIGLPDKATRKEIIDIHIQGKPYSDEIKKNELVEVTEGLSGAQIENLLNEAMLNALRYDNKEFCYKDFELVLNKMMAGWQPNEHEFTKDIIDHIAIHEMGHVIIGLLSKHHSKVSKVVLNLYSPKTPGYTVFDGSTSNIYKREALFEHLMILFGGRIAEEVFYGISVTTGAINDFEEALKLAENMIKIYGFGSNTIFPSQSEKYKELTDIEVIKLLNEANKCANIIIKNAKDFINETSEILKRDKIIKHDKLNKLLNTKYKNLLELNYYE